jgi:Terminase RNaseH-like domain/Terminase large subunit, T4likevirus-type, N-terminal
LIPNKLKNSYNGNTRLKQVGYPIQFSQDQVKELVACARDPIYFIQKYCKIVSLDLGLVDFDLYDYQKKFIDIIENNRKVISMQPRQMGKSQVVAAYCLWYTLFQANKTVAILANKANAAREIMFRYQLMYEHLPLFLQQGIRTWNKGDIELENGSIVFTAATSKSGVRGRSVNLLYVDETAIIPNNIAEEFFTAVYPVVSAGSTTKIILTSTPLGYNHFWKFWNDAEQGTNGFVSYRVKYNEHPDRDEKWAEEQRKLLGDLKFNQEVLCSFIGSSASLISGDVIASLSATPYVFTTEDGLDILEEPQKDRQYVVVVDTSRGVGGDYSAFTLTDITSIPYKVVGKYRNNKISPLLYPDIIHKVAKDFNNAYVLVEINDIGQQIADILHSDLEYENIFRVGSSTKSGQFLTSGFKGSALMGVRTTKQVKRIGCSNLKTLIETKKLLIFDKDIISELSTFIEVRGGVYGADEGYHDDLVMTLVLLAWASKDPYFKELTNVNLRNALFENQMKQIEDELTPFGIVNTGVPEKVSAEVMAGDLWVTGGMDEYMNKLKQSWYDSIPLEKERFYK